MKKIILSKLSISLLFSSKLSGEEKSYLKTKDAISENIKKYFDSSSDEQPSKFAETFYSDDVEVQINDVIIKGKEQYIKILKVLHPELI